MFKKILIFSGIAVTGYAFYYYFKKQIDLALSFDYVIKKLRILNLNSNEAEVSCELEIKNKSSFQVDIKNYDLSFSYDDVEIATAKNNQIISIPRDSTFDIRAKGFINLKNVKAKLFDLSFDILQNKPINIVINGTINVQFIGINKTLEFSNNSFVYSKNILEAVGLDDDLEKIKSNVKSYLDILK